jgi:hypothetical protein
MGVRKCTKALQKDEKKAEFSKKPKGRRFRRRCFFFAKKAKDKGTVSQKTHCPTLTEFLTNCAE